jgi:lipoprotein-anchoring transpeptidase ErfK/SrfK
MISRLPTSFRAFAGLVILLGLAACSTPEPVARSPYADLYGPIQDGELLINAVDTKYLDADSARTEVYYNGAEEPGTIVVDIHARKLYFVEEGGRAMRYAIAVGREGLAIRSDARIGRKQEWPSWTPTNNMLRTQPEMYGDYAAGLPGGLSNPLGARALYLYRGRTDTHFRIHGTIDNASIGRATSAGCIRLFNQDIIDLFNRVDIGAYVKIRSLDESLALEGPLVQNENGRMVPAGQI